MSDEMTRWAWSFAGPDNVAPLARQALWRATSPRVAILRWHGSTDNTGRFVVGSTTPFAEFDATAELRFFARACAHSVATHWPITDIVRVFLVTGNEELAAMAHHSAWAMSCELDGMPRIAARVAMYAAMGDRGVLAAREASQLALRIAASQSLVAGVDEADHQEHVLVSALLGHAYTLETIAA